MSKSSTVKTENKIHHATLAKANDNDVELTPYGTKFKAVHSSGLKTIGATAKEALEKVLEKLNSEDEEGEESGKVIVKEKYKKLYRPNNGNCGDLLAIKLTTYRGEEPNAWNKVCLENDVDPTRWDKVRNDGLRWMALSNVLRHRVMRKEKVTIGGEKITNLE